MKCSQRCATAVCAELRAHHNRAGGAPTGIAPPLPSHYCSDSNDALSLVNTGCFKAHGSMVQPGAMGRTDETFFFIVACQRLDTPSQNSYYGWWTMKPSLKDCTCLFKLCALCSLNIPMFTEAGVLI